VSLDPPLVLVCIERDANSHDGIASAGAFCVNILDCDQETIARRFADDDVTEKFRALAYHPAQSGAPVLDDALAWIDCRVWDARPAGDHTVFIGEVQAGDARAGDARGSTPLVFYRGGYGRFTP
jgi:flavin reductase (DIM6/NTAB) family NADH-FMN oxidoreductase RutF